MTRKARCLCEKDFLEKSLSPTKCCSLKYSELRLRQAMAPAGRQKGRPITYPEWSALLVPIPGAGRMLPAHPSTSFGMSRGLARALPQFAITQHQPLPLYQLRNSTKIILFQRENCWDGEKMSMDVDL